MFISVDPLADKYPGISPYVYCANNPMIYVDPDGMEYGDYYDQSGNYIGTDGIDDGKIYVVPKSIDEKRIKQNERNGGTTPKGNVSSAIELPTQSIRQEMSKVVEMDANNPFREYGGSIFEDENNIPYISWVNPGPEWQSGNTSAELDPRDHSDKSLLYKMATSISTFHSHPSGEIDGSYINPFPSATDKENANKFNSFTGNHYVFGLNSNRQGGGKVHIYDKNGVKVSFPISLFKSLGR